MLLIHCCIDTIVLPIRQNKSNIIKADFDVNSDVPQESAKTLMTSPMPTPSRMRGALSEVMEVSLDL